jgi:small subunit ribosomal protein S20
MGEKPFYNPPFPTYRKPDMANTAQARSVPVKTKQRPTQASAPRCAAIKKVRKAIDADKVGTSRIQGIPSIIDSIADKRIIHKNASAATESSVGRDQGTLIGTSSLFFETGRTAVFFVYANGCRHVEIGRYLIPDIGSL